MKTTWLPVHRSATVSPRDALTFAATRTFADQTLRQTIHLHAGGPAVRIHLSNRFGTGTLVIDEIRAAIHTGEGATDPSTDRLVTVNGMSRVKIAPGESCVSDPVDLTVPAGAELAVSIYHEAPTGPPTQNQKPLQTGYVTRGNTAAHDSYTTSDRGPAELAQLCWITGIDAALPAGVAAGPVIAAFGDSLTSGDGSTSGANKRFPDVLAARLGHPVLNLGISGNRLLRDGYGQAGLARFRHDVLEIPGISHVIIELGINDIGQAGAYRQPPPTAADLIDGLLTLAQLTLAVGAHPIVATLTPYRDTIYPDVFTEEGERVRQAVNDWIRTTPHIDAVLDIDAQLTDPSSDSSRSGRLNPIYDSGDRLHPNDTGYQAIADAFDPAILTH